jgi:molybdenum cofactor cytidylyltransferase
MGKIGGIVLAAGRSRRLGRPKQLLPFGGARLLEAVVAGLRGAPLDDLVVVLNPGLPELADELAQAGIRAVLTTPAAPACSVSIRTGLGALGAPLEAVLLLLGDQPGVGAPQVRAVTDGWRRSGKAAAVGLYRGARGHPFLLSGPALAALETIEEEKAVWRLLGEHPGWVHEVPLDQPLPRDVDDWDDYTALLAEFGLPAPQRT